MMERIAQAWNVSRWERTAVDELIIGACCFVALSLALGVWIVCRLIRKR